MYMKKFDWTYIIRFIRTVVPQLVLVMPVLVARGQEFDKYLPLWVLPTLILLASILTAFDKWARDVGFYRKVKDLLIKS